MTMKEIAKKSIRKGDLFFRSATRHLRVLPDFLIIGSQKCGTSSLYRNLVRHPFVFPAVDKEIYFFNNSYNYFQKGVDWYKSHFPSFLYKYYITHICKNDFLTGEATPGYIFHPHAPRRISELLPTVKIIILLRNPVDRAYSHYYHEVTRKRETASFEDAITMEEERLRGEFDRITNDENYKSTKYVHYSYLLRGIYIDQLKRVYNYFHENQIIILKSEDFFREPQTTFQRVFQFLKLPNWEPENFKKANVGSYPKMNIATRNWLLNYFEPYNNKLYEYLGINFGWDE